MLTKYGRLTIRLMRILKNSTNHNEPVICMLAKRRHCTTVAEVIRPPVDGEQNPKDDKDVDDTSTAYFCDSVTEKDLDFSWEHNLSQNERDRFAQIKMEYAIWANADESIPTPKMISESQWMTILDEPDAEGRLRTYMYLGEKIRLKMKEKKKTAEARPAFEQALAERLARKKAGEIDYGFIGGNFIMQRIEQSDLMRWKTKRFPNTCQLDPPLVFDLSLFKYMDSSRDISLTSKQIKMCYSMNFAHRQPFNIVFTGYDRNSKWSEVLDKQFYPFGFNALPNVVTEKSYMDLFPPEKLIYLSPDAPETLREFDSENIYIIGAMVDKTPPRKNLTYGIAKRLGIRSQKLPLDEYLKWRMGKKTLTLNHVIRTLLEVNMTNDWRSALLSSTPRKNLTDRPREKIEKSKENHELYRARFDALLSLTNLE